MSSGTLSNEICNNKEIFLYKIHCQSGMVELMVDPIDILENADGEMDCPLDVVLRKHNYSFSHLNEWNARKIEFVRVENNQEIVMNNITLNINL